MRIASLLVLPLLAGPSIAETVDRAAFVPVPEKIAAPAETVRRAASPAIEMGRATLAPADVATVDKNGDGKISFEELLRHDVALDF